MTAKPLVAASGIENLAALFTDLSAIASGFYDPADLIQIGLKRRRIRMEVSGRRETFLAVFGTDLAAIAVA